MDIHILTNIIITVVCLTGLILYFNYREKKLHTIAQKKITEIREKYLKQIAARKAKEKIEIGKLKDIVKKLEEKHRQILKEKQVSVAKVDPKEYEEIIKKAQEKAFKIEKEMKEQASKYLASQKSEVQAKMVDLVMGVTRKVISETLTYEKHKELIEKAFLEVEGEISYDD